VAKKKVVCCGLKNVFFLDVFAVCSCCFIVVENGREEERRKKRRTTIGTIKR
jgi:hypothetical protein